MSGEEFDSTIETFQALKSYRSEDDAIDAGDFPLWIERVKWDRSETQVQSYVNYINKLLGGRIPWTQLRGYMTTQHNKYELFDQCIDDCDVNRDGLISPEEFIVCFQNLKNHVPSLPEVNFAAALQEADADKDGKLSTGELSAWLKRITGA